MVGDDHDPALYKFHSMDKQEILASPDKFVVVREVDGDLHKIPWDQLCAKERQNVQNGNRARHGSE